MAAPVGPTWSSRQLRRTLLHKRLPHKRKAARPVSLHPLPLVLTGPLASQRSAQTVCGFRQIGEPPGLRCRPTQIRTCPPRPMPLKMSLTATTSLRLLSHQEPAFSLRPITPFGATTRLVSLALGP